jgi:hypothetical protein
MSTTTFKSDIETRIGAAANASYESILKDIAAKRATAQAAIATAEKAKETAVRSGKVDEALTQDKTIADQQKMLALLENYASGAAYVAPMALADYGSFQKEIGSHYVAESKKLYDSLNTMIKNAATVVEQINALADEEADVIITLENTADIFNENNTGYHGTVPAVQKLDVVERAFISDGDVRSVCNMVQNECDRLAEV